MTRSRDEIERIERAEEAWRKQIVEPRVQRFQIPESPTRFYTPASERDFDFLEKVGFPGQYPFTAGNRPFEAWRAHAEAGAKLGVRPDYGVSSAGRYSGYGTAEDYRDYLRAMQARGSRGGPNVAFDLVTQCGYDSDSPNALGEVGRVGVAIDSYRDFRVVYEAFTGERDIDQVASNFTINAPLRRDPGHARGAGRGARHPARKAARHAPERHPQGVHRPRHVHLPAPRVHAPVPRHAGLLPAAHAAHEREQHRRLPHPRGGGRRASRTWPSRWPTESPTSKRA